MNKNVKEYVPAIVMSIAIAVAVISVFAMATRAEAYDDTTTLVDTNGKLYVWDGESEYAQADVYDKYNNSTRWRKHYLTHPAGYANSFKWDCPTCLANLLAESDIVTETDDAIVYRGINYALKKAYFDTNAATDITLNQADNITGVLPSKQQAVAQATTSTALTIPPAVTGVVDSIYKGTTYSGSVSTAGFVSGTTQATDAAQMCVNFATATGLKFICIVAVPTNSADTSFRVGALFKDSNSTVTITSDSSGYYVQGAIAVNALLYDFTNNGFSFRSTVAIPSSKTYFATVTNNQVTLANMRLLYFQPNVTTGVMQYAPTDVVNVPAEYTTYDPLNKAQIAGTAYTKVVTTNSITNLAATTNNYLNAKWQAYRLKANYEVISSAGTSATDAEAYRTEGRNQVINNPSSYGLISRTTYDTYVSTHSYTNTQYNAYGQAQYQQGLRDGGGGSTTAYTLDVGEVIQGYFDGVQSTLNIADFDLFGINIRGLLMTLLILAIVIFIVKIVWGAKT